MPATERNRGLRVSRHPGPGSETRDIVGFHPDPADHAAVISAGEKPRIRASGRERNPLPMKAGHTETSRRDRSDGGSARLWRLPAPGKLTAWMAERHRSDGFSAFPRHVAGGGADAIPANASRTCPRRSTGGRRTIRSEASVSRRPPLVATSARDPETEAVAVGNAVPAPPDIRVAATGDVRVRTKPGTARSGAAGNRRNLIASWKRGYRMIETGRHDNVTIRLDRQPGYPMFTPR